MKGKLFMKHSDIIGKMTLKQKADYVTGKDFWHLKEYKEFGLPGIMITDGPNGLRKKDTSKKSKGVGLGNSVAATCFPPAVTAACSWDTELIEEEGRAIGEECLAEKVSVILGPGTNIKRSPVCGRNFEYFSEDPVLAGECSAALINGIQSMGVGASLKHFACNSQEAYRMVIDELIDERAIREIYFPAFETAVKKAKPWTVMNSYNKINGVYSSQNHWLQEKVLRGEWGFDGLIVTDWGSSVDRVKGIKAGTDLEMPSSCGINSEKIIQAVQSGELDEEELNKCVDRIIELTKKSEPALKKNCSYSVRGHHEIARRVAEGSCVLLKNEGGLLPLSGDKKIAVIGEMAKFPRFQGAGTSVINPTMLDNACGEFEKHGMEFVYAKGYNKEKDVVEPKLLNEAVNAAENCDVAVVFAGLTEEFEAEGYDRQNIDIPECHNRLIEAVAKANPNTVVVLAAGSVILMPWADKVKSILHSGLGGQAGATAVVNILMGDVTPSGKTCETYPLRFEDNPVYGNYPGGPVTSEHRESIYIGYRYYDKANLDVLFPFGFGLSYTTFEYSGLKLSSLNINENENLIVSFVVKNTGKRRGAETAQIYVCDEESTVFRPQKELKAFKKVFLEPGESKKVEFTLNKRAFAFYNVLSHNWCVESGKFDILIGASSRDIRLSETVNVFSLNNEPVPDYRKTAPAYYNDVRNITRKDFEALYGKLPENKIDPNRKIDIYCCLNDAKYTKWGAAIGRLVKAVMTKMGSGENGDGAMLAAMAVQVPIRNFVQMSMGVFSPAMADGLLMILNDDESTFKGLLKIFGSIGGALVKLPKLFKSI